VAIGASHREERLTPLPAEGSPVERGRQLLSRGCAILRLIRTFVGQYQTACQRHDDGIVCVPEKMAPQLAEIALDHEDWEDFSRIKLAEGGDLFKYYPLNEEGHAEYLTWKANRP